MDIIYETTKKFEKELRKFSPKDFTLIINKLNTRFFLNGRIVDAVCDFSLDIKEGENSLSGRIGDDGAVLILNAKGRIILKELSSAKDPWDQTANGDYTVDLGFDLADLGEQISDEIDAHMTAWSRRMENEFGPKFSAKIEKKAQEAAAKAERAATRAVRREEKALFR